MPSESMVLLIQLSEFKYFKRVLDDMTTGKMALMLRMRLFCSLHQADGRRITVDGKEVGNVYAVHIG